VSAQPVDATPSAVNFSQEEVGIPKRGHAPSITCLKAWKCLATTQTLLRERGVDGFQIELIVVGMIVPPGPVISLLVAVCFGEGHVVLGVLSSKNRIGVNFAIIPIVIVLVVAIVDPDADLRCGIGPNRHRSNQSGGQEK
jgi:hypothetical protein